MKHFEGIHQLILDEWSTEEKLPTHVWYRYILSSGIKSDNFFVSYAGLKIVKKAFGRRAFISPVNLNAHDVEKIGFEFSIKPEDGGVLVGITSLKEHVHGGPHFLIAVESEQNESDRDNSKGFEIVEAIEALLRVSLGANAVLHVHTTNHAELESGKFQISSENIVIYGPEEAARAGDSSTKLAIELLSAFDNLSPKESSRLLLALRWVNMAFREHELIYFLTAFEILAGSYKKQKVYKLFADAYGNNKPQILAKNYHLEYIYKLRNDYMHDGRFVYMSPTGASYLLAIFHDMARQLAKLTCHKYAERLIKGIAINSEFSQI